MKLKSVARFFDRLVCRDAYGTATFKAQLGLYDDATRDGLGSVRRVLSADAEVTLPTRRVIETSGALWLVGNEHPDYWAGEIVRNKYVLHRVDGLGVVRQAAQWLSGAAGLSTYCALVWVKSAKQVEISSELFDVFDIYFAQGESIAVPCFVTLAGKHYIVHETYPTEAGFTAARAAELYDPMPAAVFQRVSYDPVADTQATTDTPASVIRLRWQEHFKYFTQYSERYEAGDQQVLVAKTDVLSVQGGDLVTLAANPFRVIAAHDEGAVWSVHVRPA